MKKVLTEQQQRFLEILFEDEVKGNFVLAKKLAGYADTTPTSSIVKSLEDEILEAAKSYITRVSPKAVMSLAGVLDDPTQLGVKEKILAAKDLLDRAGLAKTEKVEVSGQGVFLLPAKRGEDDE
jgi:hypothetical protein